MSSFSWCVLQNVATNQSLAAVNFSIFIRFIQPMPCGTTLIVSPQSIAQQWLEEIEKHTEPGSLKVMVSAFFIAYLVRGRQVVKLLLLFNAACT